MISRNLIFIYYNIKLMKKSILLFDVDGTICESGKKISISMSDILNNLSLIYEIGIVGGGTFSKIIYQLDNLIIPDHIFSECGSVYHKIYNKKYDLIYKNILREEIEYDKINKLIKMSLNFISKVDYIVSGNFIDLRNGLIYISLVGMSANDDERNQFINKDLTNNYRQNLINILKNMTYRLKINDTIDVVYGGSVGIAIYPKKWNKVQILKYINLSSYDLIYFFGDKYESDGNDYELINHPDVNGIKINNISDTENFLCKLLQLNSI